MGGVIRILRIKQWIKNLFVFAPLVFSLNLFSLSNVLLTLAAFFSFSLVASSIYVVNDIVDRERDSRHPVKKNRPLPAGMISVNTAWVIGTVCLISGIALALLVNPVVFGIIGGYAVLNLFYSYWGKHIIILDIMIIAVGFVLRVLAGAFAIGVTASSWMMVATFFLALLLAIAKRYHEKEFLQVESVNHRQVLYEYSEPLLKQLLAITSAMTLVAYALYTMDRDVILVFGTDHLVFSLPFVVFGVFRYLYLVLNKEEGGDPTELVVKDKPMLITLFLWLVTVIAIIY